jgi:hypothetical protein
MGRKKRRIMGNRRRRNVDLTEIYQWIENANMPQGGWDYADPVEIQIAREKIHIAKKVAERVYNLQNTTENFRRRPDGGISPQEKRRIFQEGYSAANVASERRQAELDAYQQRLDQEAQRIRQEPRQMQMASPQQLENARMHGYAQGVVAGKALAAQEVRQPQVPATEIAAIRKTMRDDLVEQCRVISESNPGMAPGVNAVRHMIKKLG